MSKKLVAGLIGWLVLSLFLMSSVWGAASKDGKTIKKEPTTQVPTTLGQTAKSSVPTISQLKAQRPRWVTHEEMVRDLERSKSMEKAGSVYEAAAGIMEESPFFQSDVAAESSPLNFDTAGNSYYDINANHRNSRQIAIVPGSRNVGINWAKSAAPNLGKRNVLGTLWLGASKAGGDVLPNIPMNGELKGRGGFCGMTYTPRSGKLVLYSHHAEAPEGTFFAIEKVVGNFDWDQEFAIPDSIGGDTDAGFWPTAAGGYIIDPASEDYDGDGDVTSDTIEVLHFFGNEGNTAAAGNDHYFYSRGVDSAGIWIFPKFTGNIAAVVDTGQRISPTVVTSKKSRKVALIWTTERQGNYDCAGCSDIFYLESTTGGENWASANFNFSGFPGINITNFDSSDATRPTGDLMGVYDRNDNLIISWNQWVDYDILTDGVSFEADIYVWTLAFGPRKAIDGNFTDIPDGLNSEARRQTLNFPHIGVHDSTGTPSRYNFLYMTFVQYGGNDSASYTDTTVEGYLNAEVYVTCSTNNGKTWSAALNATNSKSPACPIPVSGNGTCASAAFSSCAEWVDDTIHITYMSDEYPGSLAGGDQTAGRGTNNELIYMKYPAFTPVPTVQISVIPASYFVDPESADTATLNIQNIGNANMTVDSVEHNHLKTWLILADTDTSGFTIIEGDPDQAITLIFNDASLSDGVYFDTILIYNDAPAKPLLKVPVTMIVDHVSPYYFAQFKEMSNGTVNLIVSNVTNLANQVDTGGFYRVVFVPPSDSDTTSNLFDASVFLSAELTNGDTAGGRYIFDENRFMVPLDTVVVKDTAGPITLTGTSVTLPAGSYRMARSKSAILTPDAITGVPYPGRWYGWNITQTWYMKQFGTHRSYAYCYVSMNRSGPPSWWGGPTPAYDSTSEDLYVGYAADWDVFVDTSHGQQETAADNYGRATPNTGLVWVGGVKKGPTFAQDSSWAMNHHFGFMAYLAPAVSADPYSMHVSTNPRFLYPTNGYVEKELYDLAATAGTETTLVWSIPVTDTTGMDTCVVEDSVTCTSAGDTVIADTFFCSDEFVVKMDTYNCPGAGIFADTDTVIVRSDTIPTDLNVVMTVAKLSPPYPATKQFCVVMGSVPLGDTVAAFYSSIRAEVGLNAIAGMTNATLGLGPPPVSCIAKPGDANASGNYSLGDVIATVNYIFNKPGCTPTPLCWLTSLLCRGDWNGSGTVSLGDVIQAVNYIFNKPPLGTWFAQPSGACCIPYTP